jgi:hypothetical protein
MLKFVEACLTEDDGSPARAVRRSYEIRFSRPGGPAMGLGWFRAGDQDNRWHNGMTGGYASFMAVAPQRKVGVVVLANTATDDVTELGTDVLRLALGFDVKPKPRRKEVDVAPAVLARYVGTYRLAPKFALTVTVDDGKLMIQGTGQPRLRVFAEAPTKFFSKAVDAQFTFTANDAGEFDKLILHQFGIDQTGMREAATDDSKWTLSSRFFAGRSPQFPLGLFQGPFRRLVDS